MPRQFSSAAIRSSLGYRLATCQAAFLSLVLSICAGSFSALAQSSTVKITVRSTPFAHSTLALGVTHTARSIDDMGSTPAEKSAMSILADAAAFQNQHIVGFGAGNTEVGPNAFDWSKLDRRVALIRATHGVPVLTLCCTPEWMIGGRSRNPQHPMQIAPTEAQFPAYAEFAAQVAKRYPDVEYFQVWNELKGFWNPRLKDWDIAAYTEFYNEVYDAVKRVSPRAKIGGPYLVIQLLRPGTRGTPSAVAGPYGTVNQKSLDEIKYWLSHKHGADFVTIDAHTYIGSSPSPQQAFADTQLYSDIDNWLRVQTDLPIWWAEWYSADATMSAELQNAIDAQTLMRMAPAVSVALRWQPQANDDDGPAGKKESLWTDTRFPGGGQPFPFGLTSTKFNRCFAPGVPLFSIDAQPVDIVSGLASDRCTMLVNETNTPHLVTFKGKEFALGPYEVSLF